MFSGLFNIILRAAQLAFAGIVAGITGWVLHQSNEDTPGLGRFIYTIVIAAITIAWRRAVPAADALVAVLDTVSTMVGQTISRTHLFELEHGLFRDIQAELLRPLPEVPGIESAAVYEPASRSIDVALAPDFGERLRDVTPLYLYHSRDDPEIPFEHLERYRHALPRAKVQVLDGRGHEFNQPEFPELVADIRRKSD